MPKARSIVFLVRIFEPLEISGGAFFEGGCSFQDQTSDDDRNGTDARSSSNATEALLVKGAPTFISCLPNIGGQKPVDRPSTGYLRSFSLQPTTSLADTKSDVRLWKPQSDRESDDDEDNANEKESSSDDEDMPAHRHRIARFVTSKVTFKRQAWRPGNQADLAKNRQLRLETSRTHHHFAAGHLITDDAVFLAPRSFLPVGEQLSKMEKLALGHAIRCSRFTCNRKRL
ncbi:hypothetical protein MRX96_007267 [Rhipicephalus microplus]